MRFVIVEAVALGIPWLAFLALYATDAISNGALIPLAIAIFCADAVLTVYWVVRRIRPLSDELARVRLLLGEPSG